MDDLALIGKLVMALELMIYETTHLSQRRDDGSHKCVITGDTLENARAALAEAKFSQLVTPEARDGGRMDMEVEDA